MVQRGGVNGTDGAAGVGRPTVWDRPEPPSRPAPSPLSRERIVAAAVELADADGLEAVSLRKVAAALDAGPMRLYRYLSTKEELLDLMVDAVHGEIAAATDPADPGDPDGRGGDWRAELRGCAHRTRRAALRHPWFADLLGGRPQLGPNALGNLETALAALYGAPGFTGIDAVLRAVRTVDDYLVGALRRETAERRAERATGLDKDAWRRSAGPHLSRTVATGNYPALAAAVRYGTHTDPGTAFEAGLDLVLDGIAAGLAPPG
ncbi:TetR/AcrR family transcriptional regulator [Kitasatospora sp. DSM 101779]|uniref:TetR/AcrR family transcriptional regulator n=1 Tax=Kitasatospora sp. DSM 101779 TaxID=2853165 RepID=UPI0021D9EC5F|nr:TetR/AcrR family transcriptional regulator [Kitasatospora sp. DSM 101779]MCU7820656.1 TetR/AcrR family transcriptional regulator [Kitasatospora sp. DSM 101779]